MPHKIPFLIDTDTASDDAVALIMALRHPHIDVRAITTVAGNVPVDQAARNALYVAELCDSDAPVYVGAAKPLTRPHAPADWFHGKDGLSDRGYAPQRRTPERLHAVDAILQAVEANPGIVIITIGPLTNLALALDVRPSIARNVSRFIIMGGNPCCEGNVTPAAEYNIWCDPEAARTVVRSELPVELVGWHLCRGGAVLNPVEIQQVLSYKNPIATFAIECNARAIAAFHEQTGEHGLSLPDPVAMAIAVDPTIVTAHSHHFVDIETQSELTRGMTVVDRLNIAHDERNRDFWPHHLSTQRKARIDWTIDNHRWKNLLYSLLH
ncbi:MAG TPA: nucleoside hydrolase [Methylomirabilota bacterium]|nr:nucleoside hydrolase [Methylomirabilota bacterium]